MGKPCPKHGQALISSQDMLLPASLQENTLKWFLKQPHIPRGLAARPNCEDHSLGDAGSSQNSNTVKLFSNTVKMFEFSSLHFPLVVPLFLFIYREIKSIMGNSKANGKHFSWVCLSWQHNNNCSNLTTALAVSENESSLHS